MYNVAASIFQFAVVICIQNWIFFLILAKKYFSPIKDQMRKVGTITIEYKSLIRQSVTSFAFVLITFDVSTGSFVMFCQTLEAQNANKNHPWGQKRGMYIFYRQGHLFFFTFRMDFELKGQPAQPPNCQNWNSKL